MKVRDAHYALHSDLAQYCLPAGNRDDERKFAWANSICLSFLVIAFLGLQGPVIIVRPVPPPPEEIIPVVFTPPVEESKPEQQDPEVEEPPPSEILTDTPVVATVVAADASQVAFAVPVEGPVVVAPSVKFAQAPPAAPPREAAKPKPIEFRRGENREGSYPEPSYPVEAQRKGLEGSVVLYVIVDQMGVPNSVEVQTTSGHVILDRCVIDQVRKRWRWPAGEMRHYTIPFVFKLD